MKHFPTYEEAKEAYIYKALAECKGDRARAAEIADIPIRTFYRLMKKYGGQKPSKNKFPLYMKDN